MNWQMYFVFAVFLMMIVMIASNKFRTAWVAILVATLLELSGILSFKEAWAGLGNTSVVMMGSMFIVAHGLSKTSLISRISRSMIKPGSSDNKIMFGFFIMIFFLTCFTNGTTALTIVVPLIISVCQEQNRPVSKFMQSVTILAQVWAGAIPLGGGAGGYNLTNQVIENLGGTGEFTYFTTMIAKLPLCIAVAIGMIFINHRFAPVIEADYSAKEYQFKESSLTPKQEKIAAAIFVCTILGLVSMSLTGGDNVVPCLVGALAMILFKIVTPPEVPNHIGFTVIMISVGMLPIATALSKTGGSEVIGNVINIVLGGSNNKYFVLGVFYIVCVFLTQLMSNVAVQNIFRPIAIIAAVTNGWSAVPLVLAVDIASFVAVCTPMASTVTIIGYEQGKYTMGQFIKGGLLAILLDFIAFMLWVPMMFPL